MVRAWVDKMMMHDRMILSLTMVTLLCFPRRLSQTCLHFPSPVCLSNHLPCHTGYILNPFYTKDKGGMLLQNGGICVQDYTVSFTIQNTITFNINTLMYWTNKKNVRILVYDTNCLSIW